MNRMPTGTNVRMRRSNWILLAVIFSACSPLRHASVDAPRGMRDQGCPLPHTESSLIEGSIATTEDDLHPSPERITCGALGEVSEWVDIYRVRNARLPHHLTDILDLRRPGRLYRPSPEMLIDGYGRPIQYRIAGCRYELRSVGRDGKAHTVDDFVLWDTARPSPVCSGTGTAAHSGLNGL
jgi:hypothetical protein